MGPRQGDAATQGPVATPVPSSPGALPMSAPTSPVASPRSKAPTVSTASSTASLPSKAPPVSTSIAQNVGSAMDEEEVGQAGQAAVGWVLHRADVCG